MISRKEWSETYLFCFVCGRSTFMAPPCANWPNRLETHEIARGPHRAKALKEPCCWLRVCPDCHEEMAGCPVVVQLALKKMHDSEHYDRQRVNTIRRRAKEAITETEVDVVVDLLDSGATIDECAQTVKGA